MRLPSYDKLVNSNLEWIGSIPDHWKLKRLGHYFTERRVKVSDKEYQPLSITKLGVVPRIDTAAKTQDGDNRKLVLKGDFVINSRSDRKGSSGLSALDGSVSLICTVITPQNFDPNYAHHLLRSHNFQEEYYRFGKGIVADLWSTNFSDMKNILLPVPSSTEQQKIAQFLDYETAKIDALIDEQKRLIELLREKRQAVISHAVTKGLNPDAPMKDSGVEWLGEVPEHWKVIKGSYIGQIFGSEAISESEVSEAGELPFVKVSDLSKHGLKPKVFSWYIDTDKAYKVKARANFVAFPKRGAAIFLNKVNIIPCKALLDPNLMGWQISNEHSAPFMAYVLKMRGLQELADVSTVPQINAKHITPEKFPAPSLKEQEEIVNYLTRRLGSLYSLAKLSERTIELLQERRSALISAAVTGKTDVRDWQPPAGSDTVDSNTSMQTERHYG